MIIIGGYYDICNSDDNHDEHHDIDKLEKGKRKMKVMAFNLSSLLIKGGRFNSDDESDDDNKN